MKIKDLFEKRLLKKIIYDEDKVNKSIQTAKKFLKKSIKLNQINEFELSLITSYMSMFHAARAILYNESIQEKSHFATYIYLKEKYSKEFKELIFDFNVAREQRHESLYGLETEFEKEDCKHLIQKNEEFLAIVKKIISS